MKAQAAIINFYPNLKCQMGAHVDDAELDMSKPIVSVSFGNTVGMHSRNCRKLEFTSLVFLMGGRTKETPPTALFVHSGDVVMMSGESRYCYHAIPRMLSDTIPDFLKTVNDNDPQDWKDCQQYIRNARINMNCRQVMVGA